MDQVEPDIDKTDLERRPEIKTECPYCDGDGFYMDALFLKRKCQQCGGTGWQ